MREGRLRIGIALLIVFHLFNLVIWFFGQTIAIVNYDLVASWGLQEPRSQIDPAIVAVNRGIALADTIFPIFLFAVAAFGLWSMRWYGAVVSWMIFGWSLNWPLVFWASQAFYAEAGIRHAPTGSAGIILPGALWLIAAWGAVYLYRIRAQFV